MDSISWMSWIDATDWLGKDHEILWASDGREIFRARYQESDLCEIPEERLFIKEAEKAWLEVLYIWTGHEEPKFLPANMISFLRNLTLADLLSYRFPGLDRTAINLLYAKLIAKLPRLPNPATIMEEAL